MTDALPAREQVRESQLRIGDSVRITRGALAGLAGKIHAFTAGSRCLLDIAGLVDGVQIVIRQDALAPCNGSHQSIPATHS